MYKEDLYDGGVAGPVPVGEVPMGRDLVSGSLAEGMARVAANAQRAVVTGVQMEDSRREFVAKRDLIALESETRMDVERRLHLPDGHAEALFDKQGNFREVEWENLRGRVERRLEGVGAAILDPLRRQEVQAAAGLTGARLLDGLAESWQKVQRQKLEGDWKDAYDLAVAQGRIGDAMGLVDRGAEMGLFTVNRGKVMKVGLQRKGTRQAFAERRGRGAEGAAEVLDMLLDGEAEEVQGAEEVLGTKDKVQDTKEKVEGGGDLSLDAERMKGLQKEGDVFTLNEAMLRDLTEPSAEVLTPAELRAELQQCVAGAMAIDAGDFMGPAVISDAAPPAARVAVAEANAAGGWTEAGYKEAVYALGNELVSNPHYKNLSDEAMAALIYKTVRVDGMDEQLYAGELDPGAAYESALNGYVENILSLRNGELKKRVAEAVSGGNGYESIELPEEPLKAEYVLRYACEELGRYRKGGGQNWFEEQEAISKGIAEGLERYESLGGAEAWAKFRGEQEAVDLAEAKKREEKVGVWRGRLQEAQEVAAAKAKAKKEAEAEAKTKPKKKTREELLAEKPYLGELELHFRFKANDIKRATLSVPEEEYERMCEQFECGKDDVLYCDLDGKRTGFLIVPSKDKGWTVNRAAAQVLLKGSKGSELEAVAMSLKAGSQAKMKISKKTVVGFND